MSTGKISHFILPFVLESACVKLVTLSIPFYFFLEGGDETFSSVLKSLVFCGPLLFGFYAGQVIDRSKKTAVVIVVSLSISFPLILVWLFDLYDNKSFAFILLFIVSVSSYFLTNVRLSSMPYVIEKEDLNHANSMIHVLDSVLLVSSPAVITYLFVHHLYLYVFPFSAIAMIWSGAAYYNVFRKIEYVRVSHPRRENLKGAVRRLLAFSELRPFIYLVMANNAFAGVFTFYNPVLAFDAGMLSKAEIPSILVASGVGSVIAGLTSGKINALFNPKKVMLFSALSLALVGLTSVMVSSLPFFYITSFMEGFFNSWLVIVAWTFRHQLLPKDSLGELIGVTSLLFKLASVSGLLISGVIALFFSPKVIIITFSLMIAPVCLPLARTIFINKKAVMSNEQ